MLERVIFDIFCSLFPLSSSAPTNADRPTHNSKSKMKSNWNEIIVDYMHLIDST